MESGQGKVATVHEVDGAGFGQQQIERMDIV